MSEHKSLAEALVAFQAEVPTLPKDSTNPHFRSKFTSLDTIVETVRPLLAKHGLAWSALPCVGPDGQPALRYQLLHTSGEAQQDMMPLLLSKNDSQGLGSALTYSRRYALCAVLNLVADEDDDGNAASRARQQSARPNGNGLSDEDKQALVAAAKGLKVGDIKLAMTACGIQSPQQFTGFDHVPAAKAAELAKVLAGASRD